VVRYLSEGLRTWCWEQVVFLRLRNMTVAATVMAMKATVSSLRWSMRIPDGHGMVAASIASVAMRSLYDV